MIRRFAKCRRATSLPEVLLALAIAGLAIVAIVDLITQSTRGVRSAEDRAAARLLLTDVGAMLACQPREELERLPGPAALQQLVRERIESLPAPAKAEWTRRAAPLIPGLRATVQPVPASGLLRVTLQAALADGGTVSVARLLRPDALTYELDQDPRVCGVAADVR